MKSELRPTKIDEIEFTLTITMSLRDWRKLSDQIGQYSSNYPANRFVSQIRDMAFHANAHWAETDE